MEIQDFEDELAQMTKPEVSQLKHQDMLIDAITAAKDKSVLSWWWISIPLYIAAVLLMKSTFVPHATVISNIHELTSKSNYLFDLFFLVLPIITIFINFWSIRKIHVMSGMPKTMDILKIGWFNILIIVMSIVILTFYLL